MRKKAALIIKDKVCLENGAIVEVRLWSVPVSDDKPYGYKYSLVYIVAGERIIGYDNAEGKGDHRHYGKQEEPYIFKDIDTLIKDFYNDVEKVSLTNGKD